MAVFKMHTLDEVMNLTVQDIQGHDFTEVKVKGWEELAPEQRERCIVKLRCAPSKPAHTRHVSRHCCANQRCRRRKRSSAAEERDAKRGGGRCRRARAKIKPSPSSSASRTSTPSPPDPDDPKDIENDMMGEKEAHDALVGDHGRPCYPIELGFGVFTNPGPYKDIILYWQDEPGASRFTTRWVLHFQWKRWRRFRKWQQEIRLYYVERNRFPEYQQSVLERRRRHGLDGDVELLVDQDQQSPLVNWMEYQDFEYQSYERSEKEWDEAQGQLASGQKALAKAGIPGFEGVRDPDNFGVFDAVNIEYDQEERAMWEKWRWAKQKLRLAEQRLKTAQSDDLGETVERAIWIKLFTREVTVAQMWLDELPRSNDDREDSAPRENESEEEWWEREERRREAQRERYEAESEARRGLKFAEEGLKAARLDDFGGTMEKTAWIGVVREEVRSAQTLFDESDELKAKIELKGKVLSTLGLIPAVKRKMERQKILLEWIERQRQEMTTECAETESNAHRDRTATDGSRSNKSSIASGRKRKWSPVRPIPGAVSPSELSKAPKKMSVAGDSSQAAEETTPGPSYLESGNKQGFEAEDDLPTLPLEKSALPNAKDEDGRIPFSWASTMEQTLIKQDTTCASSLDRNGLCLLSLDGGGVRGLCSLYILKGLMSRLFTERQAANLPAVKPCEVFDLIGGTSTGGLIAIMLGRLEMDLDQCIKAYTKLMKSIFDAKPTWSFWLFRIRAQFDSAKLASAFKKAIKSGTEPFNDKANRHCKVFVCATTSENKKATRLRSYSLPGKAKCHIETTIWEAARATLATTTFFDPAVIGTCKFVDSALGANNPVDEVEGEASDIWCSETGDVKPLVNCFVSIGTGDPGKKATENNIVRSPGGVLKGIEIETKKTGERFIARWHDDEKRYYRFNIEQGLQDVGIAEHQHQDAISAATEKYLEQPQQVSRVRDCVSNLKQKINVPFLRNTRFVGRDSQLRELEATLLEGDHHRRVAILGLGGAGKTQLALEFAYRVKVSRPDYSVFWVTASSVSAFEQAYLEIGLRLQIPGLAGAKKEDVKGVVKTHLSQERAGAWLLILDDADDIDIWFRNANTSNSDALIEFVPISRKGSVVFTTRDRNAAVKMAQHDIIDVSGMDETSATELLEKSLTCTELAQDHILVSQLLAQLTHLPLAIVQAAAYINEKKISISAYLSRFVDTDEYIVALLSEDFEDGGRARASRNPVATTWLLSFEQIQRQDQLAAYYLSFMSCLDVNKVPTSLLEPAKPQGRFYDAIKTLSAYSFIMERAAVQSDDPSFDVHRLVHLATRNWLKQKTALKRFTIRAIQQLARVFPSYDYERKALWTAYLPHARRLLASNDIGDDFEEKFNLCAKVGWCLMVQGKYDEAEAMFCRATKWMEKTLGEAHRATLRVHSMLAFTYWKQNRWTEAEKLERQVLDTSRRVLGEKDPYTLTSIENLALIHQDQGR